MAEEKAKSEILPLSRPAEELFKEGLELQELIQVGTEHLNRLQERLGLIKEELLFHGIKESESYTLWEKQRVVRKINVKRFAEMFPEVYTRLMEEELLRAKRNAGKKIRVQDAERMLGEDTIDPACDLDTTITHIIQRKEIA